MFLAVLTSEVKWLVESFWEGLHCNVMVPCIARCGRNSPGTGLYEVEKLIDSTSKGRTEFPCPTCNEWQPIAALLLNAPAAQPADGLDLHRNLAAIQAELAAARRQIQGFEQQTMGRFDRLDQATQRLFSQVDDQYNHLMTLTVDEAKDGPRLFSLEALETGFWDQPAWLSTKVRITLWCEHSRLPLPALNPPGDPSGGHPAAGRRHIQQAGAAAGSRKNEPGFPPQRRRAGQRLARPSGRPRQGAGGRQRGP